MSVDGSRNSVHRNELSVISEDWRSIHVVTSFFETANQRYGAILTTPPTTTGGVLGYSRRRRAFDTEPAAPALLVAPIGKIACRVRRMSVD